MDYWSVYVSALLLLAFLAFLFKGITAIGERAMMKEGYTLQGAPHAIVGLLTLAAKREEGVGERGREPSSSTR
ncbi:hypothetical protein [Hydrogenimonas sp.]